MRLLPAVTFLVLLASGCKRVAPPDGAARLAAEDAVLAAVLADTTGLLSAPARGGDTLWLAPALYAPLSRPGQVDSAAWVRYWRGVLADVPQALADDYLAAQRHERRLARPPAVPGRVVRFAPPPVWAPAAALRWVARASRVGFSAAGDSAVVDVFYTCGPICGSGGAVLLVRGAGRWTVARVLSSYVS